MRAPSIALVLALGACSSTSHAEPDRARKERSQGADPKLNKRFLDPKLDVKRWIRNFEGESREVYAHRKDIVRALRLTSGMRVADIGAGTGLFEGLFDRAVGDDGVVYAIDISPRFLDHLRKRKRRDGWKRVQVIKGSAASPNLAKSSVDLVFICDTYHHFTDVPEILADIKRALAPGGRLVIVDFHRIPGVSKKWILGHVRADMRTFKAEIEAAGLRFRGKLAIPGLKENYALEFVRP
ncbi:MAG: methyltransferase domain-containing protein [Deltaproteobacteria bacterium]|nr:methyltransferase domain-containing protein [Deltaproteobacteria bacterium]